MSVVIAEGHTLQPVAPIGATPIRSRVSAHIADHCIGIIDAAESRNITLERSCDSVVICMQIE